MVKTAIGVTATPERFDPRLGRGRKPNSRDDSREAKAYFEGVKDGETDMIETLIAAFDVESILCNTDTFSLKDIKRIIRREEW